MKTIIRFTGLQHETLKRHLYPGDNCEAVAVALCGRRHGADRHVLTVREILLIPHDVCSVRSPLSITWPTETIIPMLSSLAESGGALLKIHSHPGGFPRFSATDDNADRELFASVYGCAEGDAPHASCVMLPDGRVFGRTISSDGDFRPVASISVAGDDIDFWDAERDSVKTVPAFASRHAQAFSAGTFEVLRNRSIAVIGCSGTGSPVIEQLARLGVGRLVVVDPDRIEEVNLNRILNATEEDALAGEYKVDVIARAVRAMGTGTKVVPIARNLFDAETIRSVAECDVVFGCMDSVDGRHLLNRLAVFYSLPYFDLGVKLVADGMGGVEQICGSVHYLQPGRSSLLSRGTYTIEQLAAAALKRANPEEYDRRREEKYIAGVREERPAVISVNMLIASLAVNEFLARVHKFRDDGNENYAVTRVSLTQSAIYHEQESDGCKVFVRQVGRGDVSPLLDMPELSDEGEIETIKDEVSEHVLVQV